MGSFAPIRDAAGGIIGMQAQDETAFAQTLAETMEAVGAAEPEGENTPPRWKPGRREAAALVGGLVLAVALIALLNVVAPAPAPRLAAPTVAPTIAATAAPTPTSAPTATQAPTQTEPPTPEPPTAEPVYVPPPCDPQNPPYQVRQQVGDLGHVVGFSCTSIEEAQDNADRLAAEMKATAEAR